MVAVISFASSQPPWTRPVARNSGTITRQLTLSFVLFGVLICAVAHGQEGATAGMGPTQQELDGAASNTRDWLYATHDYADQKFVDLKQINTDNVKNLRPVCMYQAPENSTAQANPVVYRNTIFLTTQHLTVALDAADCSVRWLSKWTPKRSEAMPQNRGVAIGERPGGSRHSRRLSDRAGLRNGKTSMGTSNRGPRTRVLVHHASLNL